MLSTLVYLTPDGWPVMGSMVGKGKEAEMMSEVVDGDMVVR